MCNPVAYADWSWSRRGERRDIDWRVLLALLALVIVVLLVLYV